MTLLVAACGTAIGRSVAAYEFTADDMRQVAKQGFGERGNSYAWAMAYFKGKLYIGTNHNFLCVVRSLRSVGLGEINPEVPIECKDSLLEEDIRGRIYSYDPATGSVELVYLSPTTKSLTSDGTFVDVAVDVGYRTMTVFREPDGTEALYVGTFITTDVNGAPPRLLRSTDGRTFTQVPGPQVNTDKYVSYRSLTSFKNRLYVLAIGGTGEMTALLESSDPASGDFRIVNREGFGDPVNYSAFELAVFKGYLYVGTATLTEGFQLLKTQAVGIPPYVFQKVIVEGAYRGAFNQNVVSLLPFKDYLYVGSGFNFVGLSLVDLNPQPAEFLRVSADDHWDLICGEARSTPDGYKTPLSGLGPGCGNAFSGYIWRMVEHDGAMYMATFDLSVLAQYADNIDMDAVRANIDAASHASLYFLLDQLGPAEAADVISAVEGGFDLWSSTDGIHLTSVSRTGLGDQYSYGVRSFKSTPYGLFLGTANPFFGLRLFQAQKPGTDTDGDGIADVEDNCPLLWNYSQHDIDGDGLGDACDPDSDNDCFPDEVDPEPFHAATNVPDTDRDGQSDQCDADDDGDSIPDAQDNCRLVSNYDQADADGDGVGDACEPTDTTPEDPAGTPLPNSGASGFCGAGIAPAALLLCLSLMSTTRRVRRCNERRARRALTRSR